MTTTDTTTQPTDAPGVVVTPIDDEFVHVQYSPGRSAKLRRESVVTYHALVDTLLDRFGKDSMHWAFECPSCGDVATGADFRDALAANPLKRRDGSLETAGGILGAECIGRTIGALRVRSRSLWAGRGCDWAAYGMFGGPLTVLREDGGVMLSFRPATTVPADRGSLEFRARTPRRLHRGETITDHYGIGAVCRRAAARDWHHCAVDDCRTLIRPGVVREVCTYTPWSEAVADFGLRAWQRDHLCEEHTEEYGVWVVDLPGGKVEQVRREHAEQVTR